MVTQKVKTLRRKLIRRTERVKKYFVVPEDVFKLSQEYIKICGEDKWLREHRKSIRQDIEFLKRKRLENLDNFGFYVMVSFYRACYSMIDFVNGFNWINQQVDSYLNLLIQNNYGQIKRTTTAKDITMLEIFYDNSHKPEDFEGNPSEKYSKYRNKNNRSIRGREQKPQKDKRYLNRPSR